MSKEIIREEIDIIMETIAEQWETIRAYEGRIPLIEMDIFRENIRKLYSDLHLLDKINKAPDFNPDKIKSQLFSQPSISFEPETKPVEVTAEAPVESPQRTVKETEVITETEPEPEPPSIDLEPEKSVGETSSRKQEHLSTETEPVANTPDLMVETEPDSDYDREEKEEFIAEKLDKPAQTISKPEAVEPVKETLKQPLEPPAQKKPVIPPLPDLFGSATPTIADKYQTEKKSVKDQLTENGKDNSLGNRMQQSQITDLKSAIGINDKFLFINELFKGDLAGYNRTIESLNLCHSKQEAMNILDELRLQYNWSGNSSSFMRLTEFLKRRFAD